MEDHRASTLSFVDATREIAVIRLRTAFQDCPSDQLLRDLHTAQRASILILDATRTEYLTASDLEALLAVSRRVPHMTIRVAAPSQNIRRLFAAIRLTEVFDVFASLDEAIVGSDPAAW